MGAVTFNDFVAATAEDVERCGDDQVALVAHSDGDLTPAFAVTRFPE